MIATAAQSCVPDNIADVPDDEGFTIDFCGHVIAAAQQDGDGPWQLVLPEEGTQKYHFAFQSGRGAIATKLYGINIFYATPGQLEQYFRNRESFCDGWMANGTVTGADGDTVSVTLGMASWMNREPTPAGPFILTGFRAQVQDLLAIARGTGVRYILRTGVNVAGGATLAPLDFSGPEVISASHATVTVAGADGDEGSVYTAYGPLGLLSAFLPIGAPGTYDALPATSLRSGRVQRFTAQARDTTRRSIREVELYFRDVTERTLNLGPRLPEPTASVRVRGPFAFPTIEFPVQPEYARWASATFSPEDASDYNSVVVTAEYLGAVPGSWVITVPDLTYIPFFPAEWAFPSGKPIEFSFAAGGGNASWPFSDYNPGLATTPADGDVQRSATRWGFTIAP